MIDRINKESFENLCKERSMSLEMLSSEIDADIKILERAQNTGYIPSKVLKLVCKALNVKPKELTRKMPMSFGGMSGLD